MSRRRPLPRSPAADRIALELDAGGLAAERAAQARRELESAGAAIGMADYMIAGTCLAHSAILLTRYK